MQIRQATIEDAAAVARVEIDTWRTAYVGIVSNERLAGLSHERATERWKTRLTAVGQFAYVAVTDTGQIVGYANGGPERDGHQPYKGELYGLYVMKEYQGLGLGRALLEKIAGRLALDGYPNMILWTFTKNASSRAFYERLGGRLTGTKVIEVGDENVEAVAYGWDL